MGRPSVVCVAPMAAVLGLWQRSAPTFLSAASLPRTARPLPGRSTAFGASHCRLPCTAAQAALFAGGLSAVRQRRGVALRAKKGKGPKVVFVIGGPGSGKGTQCDFIKEELGYVHLSAGELLRAERKREGSKLGAEIEEVITNGGTVRSEIIAELLEQAMVAKGWENGKFVIDGYPRSEAQLEGWEGQLQEKVELCCCISIEVGKEELKRRLLKRGESSGRSDDNEETIVKRFETYEAETGPLLRYFDGLGKLRKVNGERKKEEVWQDVRALPGLAEAKEGGKESLKDFLING